MVKSYIDIIIRIKNGYLAGKDSVVARYFRLGERILSKLRQLKLIKDFKITNDDKKKKFLIELCYVDKKPPFNHVKIVSKPGQRIYLSYKEIKPVLGGYGYAILSTPKGLFTDKEAKRIKVGGELLFEIW